MIFDGGIPPLPDLSDEDELYAILEANSGKRKIIHMDHEQVIRTAFLVAAKRPCYICGGIPEVIRQFQLPPQLDSKLVVYGLCMECEKNPERENIVRIMATTDAELLMNPQGQEGE